MLSASKGVLHAPAVGQSESKIDVLGLGFRPRALILWWSSQASWGSALGNRGGVGLAAEGGQSAVAWASDDGTEAIRASRWLDDLAIVGFETAGADRPDVRGRLVAFDDSGFVLEWLTRPRIPWLVHYLALGGSDLTEASVFRFASIDEGVQHVDRLKFQPDFVLLVPSGVARPGDRADGILLSLGVAIDEASQAACAFQSRDVGGGGQSGSRQRTDAVAAPALPADGDRAASARLLSTDPAGFSLEWSHEGTKLGSVICLALKGGRYKIGADVSPKAPGTRRTKRLGFQPSALLAFSWGLQRSPDVKEVGRLCVGAAASSACGCATWDDEHRAAPPTKTHVHSTDEALIEVPDTGTGGVHATARISALDSDGFTLDWSRADGPARQFVYVAFGSTAAERPLRVRLLEALTRLVPYRRHADRQAAHGESRPEGVS
jgi:hypothetical protein